MKGMMEYQMHHSLGEHSLFRAKYSYGNVVLNFQHSADRELSFYAGSFHEAGHAFVEQMFARAGYNDLEACPIVFLYQLYLKAIALLGDEIVQLRGETLTSRKRLLTTHRLVPLLSLLKRTFEAIGWTWDVEIDGLRTFQEVEELLRDFEAVDPGSYTFRYVVNTEGQPSVPHHFMFHLPTLCKHMDTLFESLEAAVMGLEVIRGEIAGIARHLHDDEEE